MLNKHIVFHIKDIFLLPFHIFLFFVSFFVRRRRDIWVFSSRHGVEGGGLAIARAAQAMQLPLRLIWLTHSDRDAARAQALGLAHAPVWSCSGIWATLRAGAIFVPNGLGDVVRGAAMRSCIINTWHGVPLKKIGLSSDLYYGIKGSNIISEFLIRFVDRYARKIAKLFYNHVNYYIASSPEVKDRIKEAFGVSENKILLMGDPRADFIVNSVTAVATVQFTDERGNKNDVESWISCITNAMKISDISRVFLYAATWRESSGDDPTIPSKEDTVRIRDFCKKWNVGIVMRPHPLSTGWDVWLGEHIDNKYIFSLKSDVVHNINEVLFFFDGLITDYSSISIDYSILGRPIYFFAPDLDIYAETRGFYEPYEYITEGDHCESWAQLLKLMEDEFRNPSRMMLRLEKVERLRRRFHTYSDGRSSERIAKFIAERLEIKLE